MENAASIGTEVNGTTAGLGYLEVNVICPCKSPHWAMDKCPDAATYRC
jgi:hypothetical protein